MISTWMKRALLIPAGAFLFGAVAPADANADGWKWRKAHVYDRIEDRIDRREDRRDRRVNNGPLDRIEDRLDRLENRWDRRHGPRASRYSSRYERKLNRKIRRLERRVNGYRPHYPRRVYRTYNGYPYYRY